MHYPIKASAICILLLCEALGCSALTLGRSGGAVILGQPLDVSTTVQFDDGENITSLCLVAEIFYGDVQQPPGQIKLALAPGFNGQPAKVKIQSFNPVDEPVVAVTVRAGCAHSIARRYVFMAEVPGEASPARIAEVVSVVTVSPAVTPNQVPASQASLQKSATVKPHVGKSIFSAKPKVDTAMSTSKLKLDAIDLREQVAPVLKITDELLTQPGENDQARSAAVALWRALNAQPDEIARERRELGELDANVKALRAVTEKNELNLGDLRMRLQIAEGRRFSNGWVYGLAALLFCGLLGVLYLWRRQRGEYHLAPSWWQGATEPDTQQGHSPSLDLSGGDPSQPGGLQVRTAFVDIDLDLGLEASFTPAPNAIHLRRHSGFADMNSVPAVLPASAWVADRGFSPSTVSALRAINTEELIDVRQQADFFVSLGQYDEAIQTLRERIDDHADASPLIYLDLMQIYRKLGRRVDYNQCRDGFNRLFGATAPEFASFDVRGAGLDAYAPMMTEIISAWPHVRVIKILEAIIFRNPVDYPAPGIDLQAFDELLMLHAVATQLNDDVGGELSMK
jgi:pilus assembly protein FimV